MLSKTAWAREQQVTVAAATDEDPTADEPAELVHAVSGASYGGQASLEVTIVKDDMATLAGDGGRTAERAGHLRFDVMLSVASTADVAVHYATGAAADTGTADVDYAAVRGTLGSRPVDRAAEQPMAAAGC